MVQQTVEDLGSSPLARGLRDHLGYQRYGDGIIPARAGFTHTLSYPSREFADHPRSRGVYGCTPVACPRMSGSSPLARGLPLRPPSDDGRAGIIPARAGFTSSSPGEYIYTRDHPRSRGVYGPEARTAVADAGIIPARAGFTYSLVSRETCEHGSSPLARGLPPDAAADAAALRIIPARAGFTGNVMKETGDEGDHPRSRGVYLAALVLRRRRPGSSPLARGLPGRGRQQRLRRGSSPLARGLPHPPDRSIDGARIIPARAGFTRDVEHRIKA